MLSSLGVSAQKEAGRAKLLQRYGAETVAQMEVQTHYKYEGMLLFYTGSFQVMEGNAYRAPTEAEIMAVDLVAYDDLRQEKENVVVSDGILQKQLLLLGRVQLEELMLEALNEADRHAYLSYKASALKDASIKE